MWNPFRRKKEIRQTLEEVLIQGGLLIGETISKEQALNIPSLSACVNLIADTIASLPIFLYKESNGKIEIVKNDNRVALLNDDTQDMLDGWQWKRVLVEDYLLEGAGYSYINRRRNDIRSLHYVDEKHIGVQSSVDPIFKKYVIQVNGAPYRDWEFIKLTRKSKDGVTGKGVIEENNKLLSLVYHAMIFEEVMIKSGGNKKGFLKSQSRISKEAVEELKLAWKKLYTTGSENVVVLNNGLEFQDANNTAVEMQLAEQKIKNSDEVCKLFLVPPRILNGESDDEEYNNWVKTCILPILAAFETALNKDLLLPSEKESFYFAFDTISLEKADIEKRYKAYEIGVAQGILQIDDVRYIENLPPLGMNWIKLGLQDVLYKPDTDEIYTPNTNKLVKLGAPTEEMTNPGLPGGKVNETPSINPGLDKAQVQ